MNNPRLIVVDDDDGFRALLADVLQEAGYDVLKATNGAHALQHCERHSVAAAIIDLSMPEKEGFETIFDLRHRIPGLRIVAICGRRDHADHCLRMAALIGADATLAKPCGTAEILETVRRVLDHDSVPAGA